MVIIIMDVKKNSLDLFKIEISESSFVTIEVSVLGNLLKLLMRTKNESTPLITKL